MDRPNPLQLNLFTEVLHAYTAERDGCLDNATLYQDVAERAGIPAEAFAEREPVGKDGQLHSLLARQVRWHQQTLKHAGILKKVEDERGWWKLTKPAKAAELLGRRWLSTECMAEYVIGSAFRFREQPGFIQHLAA